MGLQGRVYASLFRRTLCACRKPDRHANLGAIAEYLIERAVPRMLQESVKDDLLDENIRLRLLPTTHPYIPTIHGVTKYKHSLNAIRLIIRNFMLNERCALHVTNSESFPRERLCEVYNTCTSMDKLVVHWQSCPDNCPHLGADDVTSEAKLGLFKAASSDILLSDSQRKEILKYINHPGQQLSQNFLVTNASSAHEAQLPISRVLSGIFIFEFDERNERIVAHTIDNVEVADQEKRIETSTPLAW
ncbi:LAMI_0G16556g1_1 [Lachancea mirantina]|uniref:LAMI_0G16556g1_1 n=1 Tax=Lachancea mirantina TaxID=1230905 RepID=A0A1G4KCQ2_9SACH|nr:LAMI_0G16556g1_1 [Lachancea mirantina]